MKRLLPRFVRKRLPEPQLRWLASTYDIGGYKRVYHYHIRKTAGTSLDAAFWRLAGVDLLGFGKRTRVCKNGLIIVRGDKRLIERGDYFYASSHLPAHELVLRPRTFTMVMLRDPLSRLLSHYRYLRWRRHDPSAEAKEPFYDELEPELGWAEGSFGDFVEQVPREHLLRQLFMFSPTYDVAEAAARVLACNAVGFTERFGDSVAEIAERLRLPLRVEHERRFSFPIEPSETELAYARDRLQPEFDLVARLTEAEAGVGQGGA